jgi:hypothetical protein
MTIEFIRKTARQLLQPNARTVAATGGLQADRRIPLWRRLRLQYRIRRQRGMRALRKAVAWDGDLDVSRASRL